MELIIGILQGLGFYVALPALVGFMMVGSLLLRQRFRARGRTKLGITGLACSVDADCPQGYVCREGVCVPATH